MEAKYIKFAWYCPICRKFYIIELDAKKKCRKVHAPLWKNMYVNTMEWPVREVHYG